MDFISEDKRTINLPVPLGTTVYGYLTVCCDACMFQKEKFKEIFGDVPGRCGKDKPCHTRLTGIQTIAVNLKNIDAVLEGWHKDIFETFNEAVQAGIKYTTENRKKLIKAGIKLDERGYSIIEEK
ncbi:MAG TPA: hypothetical protein DCS12_10975 [Clostridiales bacterium]|jgi:hypothetical protein|nr:hypothetical protein [Clostridiales bacterium]